VVEVESELVVEIEASVVEVLVTCVEEDC